MRLLQPNAFNPKVMTPNKTQTLDNDSYGVYAAEVEISGSLAGVGGGFAFHKIGNRGGHTKTNGLPRRGLIGLKTGVGIGLLRMQRNGNIQPLIGPVELNNEFFVLIEIQVELLPIDQFQHHSGPVARTEREQTVLYLHGCALPGGVGTGAEGDSAFVAKNAGPGLLHRPFADIGHGLAGERNREIVDDELGLSRQDGCEEQHNGQKILAEFHIDFEEVKFSVK